jgi:hypothetical protein
MVRDAKLEDHGSGDATVQSSDSSFMVYKERGANARVPQRRLWQQLRVSIRPCIRL